MCHAHRVTSESALPSESNAACDVTALATVVAAQRAELDRLRNAAAMAAVLERAKGATMALTGCSADAAHEELVRRAKDSGRTLVEQCWITLGGLAPRVLRDPVATGRGEPAEPGATPAVPTPRGEGPADRHDASVPARIAQALVHVRDPQELAHCLREHLAGSVRADAVLLFAGGPAGGLELIGHAGVTETLATQWRHVPPLSGVAALDTIRTRQPCWLTDFERDSERYVLIGTPPDRWLSRAWLPVITGDAVAALGILRTTGDPFPSATRELLLEVARLCAGRLHTFLPSPVQVADRLAEVVQSVFEALPGPAILLTPLRSDTGLIEDYRIDAAAPYAVDAAGRHGRALVGLRILECYPTVVGEPLWEGYRHTLTTGEPYEGEPFEYQEVVAGVPETTTYSVRAAKLGDALVVTWIRHDRADRQERRTADVQRLGNLGWADWNLVTGGANWSPQAFAVLARDPRHGPLSLDELPARVVPEDRPALSRAIEGLLDGGPPVDTPFRLGTSAGTRHLRLVAEAVNDADDRPLEVHGFLQDLTAQRSAELALVESERAVVTQHGALLAERTLADRLQHALLPLPRRAQQLAGLRVDVAYLPAQSGIHVGGDWFSAIELPDGSALFVVGDVAGHGIDAVATMAQLRFTAKGMVITGSSLTGALTRLNALLLHTHDTNATATLVLARYEPERRCLVWAQAGHPPPLLLRAGGTRYLRRPKGMLLGAKAAPSYAEAEFHVEPGDRLLFYTDGLFERPSEGFDKGLDRLAEAALHLGTEDPGVLSPLLNTMLEGERRDDVCVVAIHLPPEPA
ncbi:SpoIIE family protein phosphatase [Streptomyces avermitilis]|uniref:SpoIIE family protein phosphatase n=1 Tax=Streptomyces avermitilis TaxID=33903 RepID=UPI003724AFA6